MLLCLIGGVCRRLLGAGMSEDCAVTDAASDWALDMMRCGTPPGLAISKAAKEHGADADVVARQLQARKKHTKTGGRSGPKMTPDQRLEWARKKDQRLRRKAMGGRKRVLSSMGVAASNATPAPIATANKDTPRHIRWLLHRMRAGFTVAQVAHKYAQIWDGFESVWEPDSVYLWPAQRAKAYWRRASSRDREKGFDWFLDLASRPAESVWQYKARWDGAWRTQWSSTHIHEIEDGEEEMTKPEENRLYLSLAALQYPKPDGNKRGFPPGVRYQVFLRDDWLCRYCGAHRGDRGVTLEVDHIVPWSECKSHDLANLVTSCARCNRGKGVKSLSQNQIERLRMESLILMDEQYEEKTNHDDEVTDE